MLACIEVPLTLHFNELWEGGCPSCFWFTAGLTCVRSCTLKEMNQWIKCVVVTSPTLHCRAVMEVCPLTTSKQVSGLIYRGWSVMTPRRSSAGAQRGACIWQSPPWISSRHRWRGLGREAARQGRKTRWCTESEVLAEGPEFWWASEMCQVRSRGFLRELVPSSIHAVLLATHSR